MKAYTVFICCIIAVLGDDNESEAIGPNIAILIAAKPFIVQSNEIDPLIGIPPAAPVPQLLKLDGQYAPDYAEQLYDDGIYKPGELQKRAFDDGLYRPDNIEKTYDDGLFRPEELARRFFDDGLYRPDGLEQTFDGGLYRADGLERSFDAGGYRPDYKEKLFDDGIPKGEEYYVKHE